MYNIVENSKKLTYSEIPQNNPIRWEFLYREGDTFYVESSKIKCRDFFNDVVALFQGAEVSRIYGFDAKAHRYNDEFVYMRLTDVHGKDFYTNLNNCLLREQLDQKLPMVEVLQAENTWCIIGIPKYYWMSTYLISTLTGIIRACNQKKELPPIKEWNQALPIDIFAAAPKKAFESFLTHRLTSPRPDYWMWYNSAVNSSSKQSMSTIHNCGWIAWLNN